MTIKGPKKPKLELDVDFSDVKKVLDDLFQRFQEKVCPYCDKKMHNVTMQEVRKNPTLEGVAFRCFYCGYEENAVETKGEEGDG